MNKNPTNKKCYLYCKDNTRTRFVPWLLLYAKAVKNRENATMLIDTHKVRNSLSVIAQNNKHYILSIQLRDKNGGIVFDTEKIN